MLRRFVPGLFCRAPPWLQAAYLLLCSLERGAQADLNTASWCGGDVAQNRTGISHGLVGQVVAFDKRQPLAAAHIEVIAGAGAQGCVAIGARFIGRHTALITGVLDINARLPALQFPQQAAAQSQGGNALLYQYDRQFR